MEKNESNISKVYSNIEIEKRSYFRYLIYR